MKRVFYILSILLLSACHNEVTDCDGICRFNSGGLEFSVSFMSEKCVHIQAIPEGSVPKSENLIVGKDKALYRDMMYNSDEEKIMFSTDSLDVIYSKLTRRFSFRNKEGRLLLQEKADTSRTFIAQQCGGEESYQVEQHFGTSGDEALYGLGQFQNGVMNYRGDSVLLQQANMDIANPFMVSTNGYGLLWNNYSSTQFKDTQDGYSFTSQVGDGVDYYFMGGQNIDDVIAEYRKLTGPVPMFGKWVYGYWQSKERYKFFAELENVVEEYRKRNIPIDNIVQDWEYWGDKPQWNSMNFNEKNFADPAEVIDRLHRSHHVHFMLSVWPGFGKETAIYQELDSIGALFDEKTWAGYKIFDAYNPAARDIFWKYLKNGLFDKGVDAWWMDASEPSFRDGFTQQGQTARTLSAGNNYLGTPYRYLNTYSLVMLRDLHERLRKASDEKRVFIFTRSAFASQQKYATAIWSGDVPASWENMHKQLTAGLNLSMSGIPYWTSDTGGFFVNERGATYQDALNSDAYKELYSRWFQFGAFTPILRAHGTNIPREIWNFGQAGTPYYDNQVKYIRLRYALLPYIYSTSYRVTHDHYTMLRGLAMDFAGDPTTFDIDNAYMFGPSLLVRPVFQPMAENKSVSTYLPRHAGKYWYNYWTGEVYEGGKNHSQPSTLDVLPLYVKAGSIIPSTQVKQYAMERQDDVFNIAIYSGTDASFTLYDDEGDSYRYEQGKSSRISLLWNEENRTFTVADRAGAYNGMPASLTLNITLYQPDGKVVTREHLKYDGHKIEIQL